MKMPNRRRVLFHSVAAFAATGLARKAIATAAVQSKEHRISIKGFKFDPETIEVRVADTVTWTNFDLVPHTATGSDSDWSTEALEQSATETIVVTSDMAGGYFCQFHPQMKGQLTIVG